MKKLLLSICLSILSLATFAQKVKIPGVETITLNNIGTIEDDGKVSGYFTFYKGDKVEKKNFTYYLKISDANLKEISTIEIVKDKNAALVTAKFNGNSFMFVFLNASNKSVEFVTYNKSLKVIGTIVKEKLKNQELMMYYAAVSNNGYSGNTDLVSPVPNKGFLVYEPKKSKKLGYTFTLYSNELKSIWVNESPEDGLLHFPSVLYQDSENIALLSISKKSLMTKKYDTFFILVNANTGKESSSTPLVSTNAAKFTLNMPDAIFNARSKEFILFGEYLEANANLAKDPTLGFYSIKIGTNGAIKSEKYADYKASVKALVQDKDKEKFNEKTKFLIHDYVLTADGKMFVVGEIYKKAVDGLAVGMKLLAAAAGDNVQHNGAVIKLVITDMVIFQFDKDLDMKQINIFEKSKSDVSLPEGYGTANARMLSIMAKQVGGFDFEYSQIDEKGETFDVIYVDREKNKGEKSKFVVAAIRYNGNKYVVNKIDLDRKTDIDVILPAVKGSVYVGGYYRKLKSYESSIETFK